MSENLNEVIEETVDESTVITVPIDTTLKNSGEAADAKAVGDALDLKADKSELQAAITVNGQAADSQGVIIVTAAETAMDSEDQTTVKAAIEAVDAKTAADILMSDEPGAGTIAEEIAGIGDKTAEEIRMAEGSQTTIAEKIGAMENVDTQNSNDIIALKAKTGADLAVSQTDSQKISDALAERVKTVNQNVPDENGNVNIDHTLTADNLTSDQSQTVTGEFARRPAGGTASINTGDAWLSIIRGNRTQVGYVPESLNMTVNAAPREQGETPITATIDRDVFVEAVSGSTTINLIYTTTWSADPTTYGVTVTGEPVSGDKITIAYTAEDRGTIIQSDPQIFISTGWNLYNHETGYAIGLKYADTAQFRISGSYTAVKFSSTIDGAKTTIVPNDGLFTISSNGYIWVEGGDTTTTEVFMTWHDWVLPEDAPTTFEEYQEDVVDLRDLMEDSFPYGLLRAGDVRDEINFNTGIATSRIQRLACSAENLAQAEASGLTYEYDTNYIYLERANPVDYDMDEYDLDGMYRADDHGLEYFTGTSIAVYAICVYGNNLKNKLERDVLTISQQTLTSGEKNQVRTNIGAFSQADGDALNSKIATIKSSGSLHDLAGENGLFWLTSAVTDKPSANGGMLIIRSYANNYSTGEYISDNGVVWSITFVNNTWTYKQYQEYLGVKGLGRFTDTFTTGATGNIALGVSNNTGKYTVISPICTTVDAYCRPWIATTNNGWYITLVNPNTGATINNTQVTITYTILETY